MGNSASSRKISEDYYSVSALDDTSGAIISASPIIDDLFQETDGGTSTTDGGTSSTEEMMKRNEAMSLLLNGDAAGAFALLKEKAESGNIIACYDAGFMMMQGIGCESNLQEGLKYMEKGMKLEEDDKSRIWKSDVSVTKLGVRQSTDLSCLLLRNMFCFDYLDDRISSLEVVL